MNTETVSYLYTHKKITAQKYSDNNIYTNIYKYTILTELYDTTFPYFLCGVLVFIIF